MKKILFLNSEAVKKSLSIKATIEAMKEAFEQLSSQKAVAPVRTNISLQQENGVALFMPVYLPKSHLFGLKTVSVHKDNPQKNLPMIHAFVQVFDATTGEVVALMDGETITAYRTGAASGLATDLLANKDSSILFIIGAGVQARYQIKAVCEVREIKQIYIYDYFPERATALATEIFQEYAIKTEAVTDITKLKLADIICTCTSSSSPVFADDQIKKGVHINAIGAYRPDMIEIPIETTARALLVVDQREACLSEAGDILIPIQKGVISANHIQAEIGELIQNNHLRTNNDEITIFKSVGNAVQDLATAELILNRAKELKLGIELEL